MFQNGSPPPGFILVHLILFILDHISRMDYPSNNNILSVQWSWSEWTRCSTNKCNMYVWVRVYPHIRLYVRKKEEETGEGRRKSEITEFVPPATWWHQSFRNVSEINKTWSPSGFTIITRDSLDCYYGQVLSCSTVSKDLKNMFAASKQRRALFFVQSRFWCGCFSITSGDVKRGSPPPQFMLVNLILFILDHISRMGYPSEVQPVGVLRSWSASRWDV